MSVAKFDYIMDYIPDKELFKAVMWARKQIREGVEPSIAIRRASRYYGKDMTDIAHYCGQCASRKAKERRAE